MSSYKFKIVLLGEGRVGKTSLLLKYIDGTFSDSQDSTKQAAYREKRMTIGSTGVTLAIWDTAGQERFHSLAPIYYRDADGAVLVYDITDQNSFQKVRHWVEELRHIVGRDISLILCGNKEDLGHRQQVDDNDAHSFATQVNARVFKTSAKTGKGVEELFLAMTRTLLTSGSSQSTTSRSQQRRNQRQRRVDVIEDAPKQQAKGCC